MAAEYGSAAITTELTHWLLQLGTSPDLLDDAHAIIGDELLHARLSHEVSVEAGSTDPPALVADHLRLPRVSGGPLRDDVCRACVRVFCINETVAVPLFSAMRKSATVPVARAALDRILRDEVRHRDFGWTLLDWLIETGDGCERELAIEAAEYELGRRRTRLRSAPRGAPAELSADDSAWGLIATSRYREVLEETVARELQPRFADLGISLGSG